LIHIIPNANQYICLLNSPLCFACYSGSLNLELLSYCYIANISRMKFCMCSNMATILKPGLTLYTYGPGYYYLSFHFGVELMIILPSMLCKCLFFTITYTFLSFSRYSYHTIVPSDFWYQCRVKGGHTILNRYKNCLKNIIVAINF
jgi:hypothetical protein